MKRAGVVIVGTDTGVGKTRVAAGLVRALRRKGVEAVPWKPFATGVDPDRITPGEDADLLLRAAGWGPERLSDVSPVRLRAPLAPYSAARDAGVEISPEHVLSHVPDGEFLVVEGCGGLLVPITEDYDIRELCWQLDLPLLIVARPRLGVINHVLLTVSAAVEAGLTIASVVLSGYPGDESEVAAHSRSFLEWERALHVVAMPRVESPDDVDALADAVEQCHAYELLDWKPPRNQTARTDALTAADCRHVWHPFTQMRDWTRWDPVVIERASGPWLFDTDGNRYLDGVSSLWTNVHGHRVPEIDAAVREQLGRVAHSTLLGLANVPSIECAEALVAVTPKHLTRVFYSDSGSTAVEVALKMAFQRAKQVGEPRRRLFVRFEGAYHGDTLGAVSVGGIDLFHQVFGSLLFETIQLPAPYAYRRQEGVTEEQYAAATLAQFEETLRTRGDEIAAVVVEPVMQGAAGMIPQPPGWLPRVAAATKAAGALLVCDEVATGFGRTGRMFAVEHEGVEPDLMCVAKGLTGGYLPLAATLATERIFEAFLGEPHEGRAFFHGHTYTGNPLACAAAVANLRLMRERDTVRGAAERGEALASWLRLWIEGHPHVAAASCAGSSSCGTARRRSRSTCATASAGRCARRRWPAACASAPSATSSC
jgi:adenosylmethionine---8-amino-7-oxononanoate aminotransferase